jgi:hypothetical protein
MFSRREVVKYGVTIGGFGFTGRGKWIVLGVTFTLGAYNVELDRGWR